MKTYTFHFRRTLITFVVSSVAVLISYYMHLIQDMILLVPVIFSLAFPLANFDIINIRKKYEAFILTPLLAVFVFLFTVVSGIVIAELFKGMMSMYLVCFLSSIAALLALSLVIKIDQLKWGLFITGFFSLTIPISNLLLEASLKGLHHDDIMGLFLITWQLTIGLAIAITLGIRKQPEDSSG